MIDDKVRYQSVTSRNGHFLSQMSLVEMQEVCCNLLVILKSDILVSDVVVALFLMLSGIGIEESETFKFAIRRFYQIYN